ncbi:MAG: YigZ family protein [Phycisphaerae bacterium]|nr:MAG: YigZ family protein [Phycisphaerae bacterium]
MQYNVPAQPCRVETRVSNSRFITTIRRADTVKDAQAIIREIRAEMPDANHHVYAYKIGYPPSVSEGMSDDGEPSGTSGPPVLAVLRGADLGDTVVVVTRYFGGTKLGTGGLVVAYTKSAQEAFADLVTERKVERITCTITYPYQLHQTIGKMIPEFEVMTEQEEFGAEVSLTVLVPLESLDAFTQSVSDVSAGQVQVKQISD